MKFVDYKCLESLLIEGEEIAQEGILKTTGKIVGGTSNYEESYMIPAMESVNASLFYTIFAEKDYMNYNTSMAKVKNTTYNLSDYKYLSDIMRVVIQDKWSESDFIKFIENNIKYTNKSMEIYYWAEDDDTDSLSAQDKKNQKIWDNLKLVCVSEDGGGNTLFYSKSKHGFYFINHEKSFEENMKTFIKWKDAVDGFKQFDLKYSTAFNYCEKLINFYNIGNKCMLIISNDNNIAFSIKTRKEYNIENVIDQIITRVKQAYLNKFKVTKEVDDDKIYYDFYINEK